MLLEASPPRSIDRNSAPQTLITCRKSIASKSLPLPFPPEDLDQKLIKGRIIDRESSGEPDNPIIELTGEDMEEILHERTFTKEYATATQISQIVKDIIDEHTEFTRVSVDDTNLAIKNKFKEEGVFSLLGKLAETA